MIDSRTQQVRTRLLVVVVLVAAGFAAVAATARASSSSMTTIGSRHTTKAGVVLASSRGQVLFLFNRDRDGTSSCYGRCERNWRPLQASGRPVAVPGSGVKQQWLSTTRRRDGILQVTYQGHPLYVNVGNKPGSLNGDLANEFGGRWYAMPISGVHSAAHRP